MLLHMERFHSFLWLSNITLYICMYTFSSFIFWWALRLFPSKNYFLNGGWVAHSVQFSSVTQSCPTFCDPMNRSMPGLPVHHQLPEFTQTHVHWVGDAIRPSHPLSPPPPPAPNPSQHQGLFQWVNSSHEVAKVLEFQPQQVKGKFNVMGWIAFLHISLIW